MPSSGEYLSLACDLDYVHQTPWLAFVLLAW